MAETKMNRPFPIWVLNLERSRDRREYMEKQLNNLNWQFEIIPAVDGKCLGSEELKYYSAQQAIKTIERELNPGEIGCALSHAKIWARIVAENIEEVLILEDDVLIKSELKDVLERRYTFPEDWEFINFRTDVDKIPFGLPVYTEYRVCHFQTYANRTCAYFINIRGAKKLCDHVYPIRWAADGLTGRTYISDLISYGMYPHLVELTNFPSVRSDEISGTFIDDIGREANMPIEQSTSASVTPPLVSAIVSAYNAERFIRGCLEDLEAQTIAERLEIVVVDSGSPQNEWIIVREFQQRYNNIVYIRTARRESIYAAWNRGIQAARGTYITNANTDDRHKRDAFERMVATLEIRPDIALVYANAYMTRTENETFEAHTPVGELNWPDFDPLELLYRCHMGPQPMWRKSMHTTYGYFDESFEVAGDWEFWLRMAENETFLHLREFLGLYLSSPTGAENRNHELLGQENLRVYQRYVHRADQLTKAEVVSGAAIAIPMNIPADQPTNAGAASGAAASKSMNIKAYKLYDRAAVVQHAAVERDADATPGAISADRAMRAASGTGWVLLCPHAFEATWNGGPGAEDIDIRLDAADSDAPAFVQSNLGGGLLTLYSGYQLQTTEPDSLWVRGPINWPKDGLYPLDQIVDTSLLPCTINFTWKCMRPNHTIRFAAGEPFGTILPYAKSAQENVTLDVVELDSDGDAYAQAFQQMIDNAAMQSVFRRLGATPVATPPVLGIVFSRDRAMQLDATLRSFHLYCQDADAITLYVIYKTTNKCHAQQYAQLKREYAAYGYIHFIEETDFRENVVRLLVSQGTNDQAGYILFLVDDNIFVRDFSLSEIRATLADHPEAAGFSLRLGANTTWQYPFNRAQVAPTLKPVRENIRLFDWTTAQGDFNYPLEISSSVFRSGEMTRLLDQLSFTNPNTLESFMQECDSMLRANHPYLLCYEQSVTFCNPVNKVQTEVANRAGAAPEYSAGHLAELFDQGYRIRGDAYAGFVPRGCHQEVELIFEQRLAATPAPPDQVQSSDSTATASRWVAQLTNPPPVSCICLTYGRPDLLEEAIYSFLQQDYPGQKELIVLNDYDGQLLAFEHSEVRVINVPKRFRTVGEKRNMAVALASHDLLIVWDDDDICLPHRLSFSVAHFNQKRGFFKASSAWLWDDGALSGPHRNNLHGISCWSRRLFDTVQGYGAVGSGEDMVFEHLLEHQFPGSTSAYDIWPEEIYYLYRWNGTGSYHISAFGDYHPSANIGHQEVEEFVHQRASQGAIPQGRILLQPHWNTDYRQLASCYIATLAEAEALVQSE
jgi:GR25 family glycosyltransferase involved in LPS biosynthesis/glycosyltransferase involved in cell wall biosynthesis